MISAPSWFHIPVRVRSKSLFYASYEKATAVLGFMLISKRKRLPGLALFFSEAGFFSGIRTVEA
jgi:hypothetical protein